MPEEAEALGVEAPRREAEAVRQALRRMDALSSDLRPLRLGETIVFPLKSGASPERVSGLLGGRLRVRQHRFLRIKRRPTSIKEAAAGHVPQHLLDLVPSSFDVIGDIAVVEIREELMKYGEEIARGIMAMNPSVKTVLAKAGPVSGEFRVREYIHLAGEKKTTTLHRENGCVFELDLARVYFSPRLGAERLRVVSQVRGGELVVDMFAGVGPFSVEIAKHRGARVTAVEINPDAYEFLRRNIARNSVGGLVEPLLGDAAGVLAGRSGVADRVIMNNPSRSLDFLSTALRVAKPSAVIHLYGFAEAPPSWEMEVNRRLSGMGVMHSGLSVREVLEASPKKRLLVADVYL